MPRGQFDALRLDLVDGERVHVYGRPSCSRRAATSACARCRSSASASASTSRRSSGSSGSSPPRGCSTPSASGRCPASPAHRPRHRQRRRREARRAHRDQRPLPACPTCSSPRRYVQGPRAAPAIVAALRALCTRRRSTSSFSPAAAEASKTCFRSATSGWCGRSQPVRCRSCRPSATSRTRRSATWPPTSAPRRRPRRRGSSCPTWPSCWTPRAIARRLAAAPAHASSGSARARAGARAAAPGARSCSSSGARAASSRRADGSARSPAATLDRGYAIVRARGRRSCATRRPGRGDQVDVELGRWLRGACRGDAVNAEPGFEAAQPSSKRIVERLESGEAELEEAIALWERGEELYRLCARSSTPRREDRGARASRRGGQALGISSAQTLRRISAVTAPPSSFRKSPSSPTSTSARFRVSPAR